MNQAFSSVGCEIFDCPKFRLCHISDNVLRMDFKLKHLNIEAARCIVSTRLRHTDVMPYPVLFNTNSLVRVDEEAYHYMAGSKGTERIQCAAFLLNNEINHLIFEVWTQFEPAIPVRAFEIYEEGKALNWLQSVSKKIRSGPVK